MKNVVIVCDYAYIEGGATKVAIDTALALANNTDLNVYYFTGCGEICEELRNSAVHAVSLNMYDLVGNPSKFNAFINGIYNRKVEVAFEKFLSNMDVCETVVHIHTWTKVLSSSIFKVCEKLSIRTFLTLHDYFLACPNGGCYNYVKHHICEYAPMSVKCVMCNCDSRNYIYKLWRCLRQLRQNAVIRHFSDLNYIFISVFQENELLRRCNWIRHKRLLTNCIPASDTSQIDVIKNNYFAFIGRVTQEKGVDIFCEAVTNANVYGLVIGDGPLLEELKKTYPNIHFTGWQNKVQIGQWLEKTRALVFPSVWYEGSPLTVPEVQSRGIPCIVTNCCAARDDIAQGINGEVVEPCVDGIVEAITRFMDTNYIRTLSNNTYRMFDRNRTAETIYMKKLLQAYNSI